MSGESTDDPWARWRWFEFSLSQGVNNLCTFAIEEKAQKKKNFNLKHNINSYMNIYVPNFSYFSLPHIRRAKASD
jgi:hypothetical protein